MSEEQIEAMEWLNDNDVEPTTELEVINGIFGIIYSESTGWIIT